MTEKLRLGPLPRSEVVRLTVTLPASVKSDLDRYAELFGVTYGEPVDPAALVPHMLAAFMERDRGFRKARQLSGSRTTKLSGSRSISSASSITRDEAGEPSASE